MRKEEKFEDSFLHWVETDNLSIGKLADDTKRDPILNRLNVRKYHQISKSNAINIGAHLGILQDVLYLVYDAIPLKLASK